MAEARRRERWDHTALLATLLVNSNPFRSGSPARLSDFHPFERRAARPEAKHDISILQVFVKR